MKDYFRNNEMIGRMRDRVNLLEPVYAKNAYGEDSKSYTAQPAVWAHMDFKTTNSNEYVTGTRITSEANCQITIRFNPAVTADWRVRHNQEEFNIISVLPDAKRNYCLLECILDKPVENY
jgi:SPP1 family predicted phage head-tail adaptor